MRGPLPLLLLLCLGPTGCGKPASDAKAAPPATVTWLHAFEEASALALTAHKPLLIHFSGPGCGFCERMSSETFGNPRVAAAVMRGFVPLHVDVSEDADTAQRFDIAGIPATHVTSPGGRTLDSQVGFMPPEEFLAWLKAACEKTER